MTQKRVIPSTDEYADELHDASTFVKTIKDELAGLGSILEEKICTGDLSLSKDEWLAGKEQEKLLLIAMIEDLLSCENALSEKAEDWIPLVSPSLSSRENLDLTDPEGKAMIFRFEGSVENIYATLVVRLSHTGLFKKKRLWKDAVAFAASIDGTCGVFLRANDEERGELIVFFDNKATDEARLHFEEYICAHLLRWAHPGSVQRQRIFACSSCGFAVPEQLVRIRSERGLNWVNCPGCEKQRIWLLDREEQFTSIPLSRVQEKDHIAKIQSDRTVAQSSLQGKIKTGDFDVFLCYNNNNKDEVKKIGERLKERGILPWLDEWELRPGLPWQRTLAQQIGQIKSAAVFVGKGGVGPWQEEEIEAFLSEFVKRGVPVIPVLLSNATKKPQLPIFLRGRTWVDFRQWNPDPIERLTWGITGVRNPISHIQDKLRDT